MEKTTLPLTIEVLPIPVGEMDFAAAWKQMQEELLASYLLPKRLTEGTHGDKE